MARCTTIAQLLQAQTKRFAAAQLSMAQMVQLDAEEGEKLFLENVSGHLPPSVTRGSFARGVKPKTGQLKRGRIPGLPINVQSNRLRSSVKLWKSGKNQFSLGATAPYGRFVLSPSGTRKMVARTKGGRPLLGPRGILSQHQKLNNKARRMSLQQAHRSI